MKAGTMEGLIGASQNAKMTNVPMRVYREAERKGDLSTMERAMGYAADCQQKAEEYSEKAKKALAEEQKEEREELEKRIEAKRAEKKEAEKEKTEKAEEKNKNQNGKWVEIDISEEGKALAEGSSSGVTAATTVLNDADVSVSYNKQGVSGTESRASEISVTV